MELTNSAGTLAIFTQVFAIPLPIPFTNLGIRFLSTIDFHVLYIQ